MSERDTGIRKAYAGDSSSGRTPAMVCGSSMSTDRRSQSRIQRLLAVGFLLIIFLLLADGFVGVQSVQSIQRTASQLAEDQYLQMSLIDEVQREQGALSGIFYRLAGDPDSLDTAKILNQISTIEQNLLQILSMAPLEKPDGPAWRKLEAGSTGFAFEARRLLARENPPTFFSRELLRRHEEVVATVAQLIRSSHRKAQRSRERIESLSMSQVRKDVLLLGGCLILSSLCAVMVLRTASRLYQKMTEQSVELNRVSWQLLDNQEMVARRLSHELHDELGQTLTALKTNLTRHAKAPCVDAAWMDDCAELLKESMRNTHEISQLLHPTILDDFGLEAALSWLCERFQERTGIEVDYSSEFQGRLTAETETHLFRIAQEALTNVARHSNATLVSVRLQPDGDKIHLAIRDNGRGLPAAEQIRKGALGLAGMQARARSSEGDLTIRSGSHQGVTVEVSVPLEKKRDEEKNSSLVS